MLKILILLLTFIHYLNTTELTINVLRKDEIENVTSSLATINLKKTQISSLRDTRKYNLVNNILLLWLLINFILFDFVYANNANDQCLIEELHEIQALSCKTLQECLNQDIFKNNFCPEFLICKSSQDHCFNACVQEYIRWENHKRVYYLKWAFKKLCEYDYLTCDYSDFKAHKLISQKISNDAIEICISPIERLLNNCVYRYLLYYKECFKSYSCKSIQIQSKPEIIRLINKANNLKFDSALIQELVFNLIMLNLVLYKLITNC